MEIYVEFAEITNLMGLKINGTPYDRVRKIKYRKIGTQKLSGLVAGVSPSVISVLAPMFT